jgi:hypothetical protein
MNARTPLDRRPGRSKAGTSVADRQGGHGVADPVVRDDAEGRDDLVGVVDHAAQDGLDGLTAVFGVGQQLVVEPVVFDQPAADVALLLELVGVEPGAKPGQEALLIGRQDPP